MNIFFEKACYLRLVYDWSTFFFWTKYQNVLFKKILLFEMPRKTKVQTNFFLNLFHCIFTFILFCEWKKKLTACKNSMKWKKKSFPSIHHISQIFTFQPLFPFLPFLHPAWLLVFTHPMIVNHTHTLSNPLCLLLFRQHSSSSFLSSSPPTFSLSSPPTDHPSYIICCWGFSLPSPLYPHSSASIRTPLLRPACPFCLLHLSALPGAGAWWAGHIGIGEQS
jgi:hypothetical protein